MNLEASARLQTLCFLELPVVGTEEHGHIPDRSLQQIVDTNAEASSDVCHIAIMINAGEQTKTVDEQHFGISDGIFRCLCIPSHSPSLQL